MRKTQGQWLRGKILKWRGVDIMPEARIISVLELCTSHVPRLVADAFEECRDGDFYRSDTTSRWGVICHPVTWGWLVYMPQDDADWEADLREHGCPAELLTVMGYAMATGVAYILFDADVEEISELPVFDWES